MHLKEEIARQLAAQNFSPNWHQFLSDAEKIIETTKRFLLHNGASQVIIDMIEQEHMP